MASTLPRSKRAQKSKIEEVLRPCCSYPVSWVQHNVGEDSTGAREKTHVTDQAFSLITLHNYWENYQQRLIATITPLSSEQLALPVVSHQTIGDLLGHMIGARFW